MFGCSGFTLIFLDIPTRMLPALVMLELLLTLLQLLLILLTLLGLCAVSGLSVLLLLSRGVTVLSLSNRCSRGCCSLGVILAMPK